MKLAELERHLRRHGCALYREGAAHNIWFKPCVAQDRQRPAPSRKQGRHSASHLHGWPAHGLVAQIYVEDSDELFQRAVDAGAREIMPMTDMFFGSREGRVMDPFGNVWTIIATLKEEVAPEEMQGRMKAQGY